MLDRVALLPLPYWLGRTLRPLGHIGEVAYVAAVCRLAEKADALERSGRTEQALQTFKTIAAIDDPLVGEVVDRYRVKLERAGLASPASVEAEYGAMLEALPERERSLHLARQVSRSLASGPPQLQREKLESQLFVLLKTARSHGPLSKREERTFSSLERRFSNGSPAEKSH